jgi:threonine dehydrogenase-like Zn-dependent dehydrogenase
MARISGAGTLIVAGMSQDAPRLAAARALGVTHAVDLEAADLAALVRTLGDGLGADLVVDATGTSIALKTALEVGAAGRPGHQGRLGPAAPRLLPRSSRAEGGHPAGQLQPHLPELGAGGEAAAAGQINLEPIVSRVSPLGGMARLLRRDAQRTLREGGVQP